MQPNANCSNLLWFNLTTDAMRCSLVCRKFGTITNLGPTAPSTAKNIFNRRLAHWRRHDNGGSRDTLAVSGVGKWTGKSYPRSVQPNLRPMSHLRFYRAILLRNFIAR